MQALLTKKEKRDGQGWKKFQQGMQTLKLQRSRAQREAEDIQAVLKDAQKQAGKLPFHLRNLRQHFRLLSLCILPCCACSDTSKVPAHIQFIAKLEAH